MIGFFFVCTPVGTPQLIVFGVSSFNDFQSYHQINLFIHRPNYDYDGNFKLKVLNWKKGNQASYVTTALKFDISNYGTIANWQRKFERGGVRALFTKRGRSRRMPNNHHGKHDNQTSPSELELLRAENRGLRVENEYFKYPLSWTKNPT